MALRERVRKALKRTSTSNSEVSSASKTSSRKNSNIYQPGERMPPMKYRRPVNPEHKKKLDSFTFGESWRRKSQQSQYSPMGSRMPSRRNSIVSVGRKSFQAVRRLGSTSTKGGEDASGLHGQSPLSRPPTHEEVPPDTLPSEHQPRSGLRHEMDQPETPRDTPNGSQPFTQEQLALALSRSHLQVPSP